MSFCEIPSYLRAMYIIKTLLKIVLIVAPLVVIITSIFSFFKLVTSGKVEDLRNAGFSLFRKIIACLCIVMIPSLVSAILNILINNNTFNEEYAKCMENATLDRINLLEQVEEAYGLANEALANPNKESIAKAREALQQIYTTGDEDHVVELLKKLSDAESEASKSETVSGCAKVGGTYDGGYCFVLEKIEEPTTGGEGGSGGSGGSGGAGDIGGSGDTGSSGDSGESMQFPESGSGTGTKLLSTLNETWVVPDTKVSVANYYNFIKKTSFAETKNLSRYSDHCLGFAYAHSYGMYTGNTKIGAENGYKYWGASHFTSYVNNDIKMVLKLVYQEINAGRPVVIQVNGNRKGTSRHYVSVVGYKKSVTSADNLTQKDLLIIDSYDGRLERMDTSSSRFMVTGAACHKSYSGYQAYYIKH